VMQASSPVDGNVRLLFVQFHSTNCFTSTSNLRARLTSLHLFAVFRHVVRSDRAQELNVVVAVVLGHLLSTSFIFTYIYLHFSVETIVQQQVVGHSDPMGFHGMTLSVIIVSNITYKKQTQRNDGSISLLINNTKEKNKDQGTLEHLKKPVLPQTCPQCCLPEIIDVAAEPTFNWV
uniref:Uncharacterized protein n=1 Tax=Oryzias latipes TaxID=8090 RepID=A0A3P9I247_ORYLA